MHTHIWRIISTYTQKQDKDYHSRQWSKQNQKKLRDKIDKEVLDKLYLDHNSDSGICDEERSMISPDYARNFICDFILGKEQEYSQRSLFEE